jgi:hypothetical protein
LICTRVSSLSTDSIALIDPESSKIHIVSDNTESLAPVDISYPSRHSLDEADVILDLESRPEAVLPMRLNEDAQSDLLILRSNQSALGVVTTQTQMVFAVTNTNDSGPGSLRQAILAANANPGADTISFNIPGSGVPTIRPQTLDNPFSPLPLLTGPVIIDGTTQPSGLVELDGTNFTGDADGSTFSGLVVSDGNSVIRGLVINRFGIGIFLGLPPFLRNNIIEHNFIGTDPTGTTELGKGWGVIISASSNNLIGGTTVEARNIISGNPFGGLVIQSSSGNRVQGNFIGTDSRGISKVSNHGDGVKIECESPNNLIGGTAIGARNIISGNETGITVVGAPPFCNSAEGTLIQGNYIGTDNFGTKPLGNLNLGVISFTPNITIGGTTPAARNIISSNASTGIIITSPRASNNLVQGNYIGTDVSGSQPLGNGHSGITITQAPDNTIGGALSNALNLISSNAVYGVGIGILRIDPFTQEPFIGQNGATVQGNFIGTDVTGTNSLGNGIDGIFVEVESVDNKIDENRIAFNRGNGINIPNATPDPARSGRRIEIVSNSIFSNAGLPIDLGSNGSSPNDDKDPDVGANALQNFPIITSALVAGSEVTIKWKFNSTPNNKFRLQFFHTGSCEGCTGSASFCLIPIVINTTEIETDANGNASNTLTFPIPTGRTGGVVNCTATSLDGNTSEISPSCIALCTSFCPVNVSIDTTSMTGVAVSYSMPALFGDCGGAITVCSPESGSIFPIGTTRVGCTTTDNSNNTAICSFTVTITHRPGPRIASASHSGKKLFVNGERFDNGAVILINSQSQKTKFDSSSKLIGKKAGKIVKLGDRLRVRNPDGIVSDEFIYRP